jgi:hypothetical protein
MATVEVIRVEKIMNNEVEVRIEARTSAGRIPMQIRFGDQGSMALNEKHAFQEALTVVEETAIEIRRLLGS